MVMQEEDLRKFLDKFFERHYKMKIKLNNILENNPYHIFNTKFNYRFEKFDGNYLTSIFDVPCV